MTAVQWVVIGWGVTTILLAVAWSRAHRAIKQLGNPQPSSHLHLVRGEQR